MWCNESKWSQNCYEAAVQNSKPQSLNRVVIAYDIGWSWYNWYTKVDENSTLIGFIKLATDCQLCGGAK